MAREWIIAGSFRLNPDKVLYIALRDVEPGHQQTGQGARPVALIALELPGTPAGCLVLTFEDSSPEAKGLRAYFGDPG